MSQSLAKNYLHLIFSTKDRRPSIPAVLREELHAYIGGICNDLDSPLIAIHSLADHLHLLFVLNKNLALSRALQQIKGGSSRWMSQQATLRPETMAHLRDFAWQGGYGAFSIGESNIEAVCKYIAQQPVHHQKVSFQDEFRKILQRYKIAFDERWVWD